jgi:fumarylacetoacetase
LLLIDTVLLSPDALALAICCEAPPLLFSFAEFSPSLCLLFPSLCAMSFVESAAGSDFPIQNLPYGVLKAGETSHCATAIGDQVLDLHACAEAGLFSGTDFETAFKSPLLNDFMELGSESWRAARARLTELLSKGSPLEGDADLRTKCMKKQSEVEMILPCHIGGVFALLVCLCLFWRGLGRWEPFSLSSCSSFFFRQKCSDYTDFYASKEHATNIGTMFRGADNALMANWTWLPVGYHGRASSVVVSGTDLHRPRGQLQLEGPPKHDVCKRMDFEMEVGFFVGGKENALGRPLTMKEAEDRLFGVTLMNDWSARDVQKWEYVPLGPFGAKNFGTTLAPWIVTMDALEPFRVAGPVQDPAPLDYLKDDKPSAFDIALQVAIQSEKMAAAGTPPHPVCNTNLKYLYWSMVQQIAHHTVTGCNMRAGDLLGTGTISGPDKTSYGSMVELSWGGKEKITLSSGEERTFLDDGDTVVMTGECAGEGFKIGFGLCSGKVLPAVQWPPQD